MTHKTQALIDYLSKFVTEQRREKIQRIASLRTRHITVALEDLYQSHNAGAIVRSCEAFGVQDIHCITGRNTFAVKNAISSGATKWLNINQYETAQHCIEQLKQKDYVIVATSPHATCSLEELPLDQKVALFFGTELEGLTQKTIDQADRLVKIPMYGFTESFNVSVSVALCVYALVRRLRLSDLPWQLSTGEQSQLMLDWLEQSVERADLLKQRFLSESF